MSINPISAQMKMPDIQTGGQKDVSSIDRKIEQLKKQMEQVKKNKQLSPEEKEKRTKSIQKQIENLEKQKTQAAKEAKQNDASAVEAKEVQEVEKAVLEDQLKPTEESLDLKRRFDTFEHQPESQTPGVYEISRDKDGNPVVKFDGRSKGDSPDQLNKNLDTGEKSQIVKTTANTDGMDKEISQLKDSLSETKQRLSSENDPDEKEALEENLKMLMTELKQKDNDRQQHMKTPHQETVPQVGG